MSRKSLFIHMLLLIVGLGYSLGADLELRARVIDLQSGTPLPGVELFSSTQGVVTDSIGTFVMVIDPGDSVTVRCMGYQTRHLAVGDIAETLALKPAVLEGQSINISASRVIPGISPVAYSVVDRDEIQARYSVEDVPMILSSEAGIYAYSESGNGTGYSYVSIRGFDQSKIAVMLDNVPLNDNESHQVYWVDHGDILSNAQDVEIQRGIGSSLYGASAFGGSINIKTRIHSVQEALQVSVLQGSYNTHKYRAQYDSGNRLGPHFSLLARTSLLKSDGYRVDSRSEQRSLMLALEQRSTSWVNQFRATLGKEISVLQWDGISATYLQDPVLRRARMDWTVPFTDDYFQQVYSLNSRYLINDHATLRNVVYRVIGHGFYEVQKFGRDLYSYNLDIHDLYPDSIEQITTTDLRRRKWINNDYYGITPILTYEARRWRTDLGLELRSYRGDHFGEVMQVSDSTIAINLPDPYTYYSYVGNKQLATAFGQLLLRIWPEMSITLDLRAQKIAWQLDQEQILHASGAQLGADWLFINPRLGMNYELSKRLNLFAGIGRSESEPADAQIIAADDVWSTPNSAPAEGVVNSEMGLNWFNGQQQLAVNLYQITYQNELLSDSYDFQDGSFKVRTANLTLHQGLEVAYKTQVTQTLKLDLNVTFSQNKFTGGDLDGKLLPNVPSILANGLLQYRVLERLSASLTFKYVGQQYIDDENTAELVIPAYIVNDLGAGLKLNQIKLQLKVNNIFNTQYATYGYAYYGGYYWPGATRNYTLDLSYSFN